MLILPLDRPIDWRRPPVMVFALLLLNVGIYFGAQLDDRRAEAEAFQWYYESGLAEIELPHYRDWLLAHGDREFVDAHDDRLQEPASPWLGRMLADGAFLQALDNGEIIAPDDPEYSRWRSLHDGFVSRLEQSKTMAWGLKPAVNEPATWVAHMFLHGGVLHLVGNMVFLVAVGFLVEMALGSLMLLGLYLLAGFGAAGLFVLVNPGQAIPLVGASGAIAGLMGLLAVVYGRQRIRFFYFIGVYFDYVKAPAIALLPLWLGYELYQFVGADERNPIAYSAHIGGLVTGALAATGIRYGTSLIDHGYIREREREETIEAQLEDVRDAIRALRPEAGRPLLQRLQREFPDDPRILQAAWELARLDPASEAVHRAAGDIFTQPGDNPDSREWILATWRDYRQRARPKPRLSRHAMDRLAEHLLMAGEIDEARALVRPMLRHPERFRRAAELGGRLAVALERAGRRDQARRWYAEVARACPDTEDGRLAERARRRLAAGGAGSGPRA